MLRSVLKFSVLLAHLVVLFFTCKLRIPSFTPSWGFLVHQSRSAPPLGAGTVKYQIEKEKKRTVLWYQKLLISVHPQNQDSSPYINYMLICIFRHLSLPPTTTLCLSENGFSAVFLLFSLICPSLIAQ
jgi:hypothetical protein